MFEQGRPGRRSELLELVELEIREPLSSYEFPGDDPIVPVRRLLLLRTKQGDRRGRHPQADGWGDEYIPTLERPIDQPFLMPIEDVFDPGRGTVRPAASSGIVKVGEEVEIVGIRPTQKTTVTGVEMFASCSIRARLATTSVSVAVSAVRTSSAVRFCASRVR